MAAEPNILFRKENDWFFIFYNIILLFIFIFIFLFVFGE